MNCRIFDFYRGIIDYIIDSTVFLRNGKIKNLASFVKLDENDKSDDETIRIENGEEDNGSDNNIENCI
ncbi:685_t:CDS:2 [Entrophospora sp. SA101]|nr:685_t:CDS:2 [Entrophospora sp. SA101]